MTITTTFRQATVKFYSFSEWEMTEEWCMSLALGYYSEEDNTLHILKDLKGLKTNPECPKVYLNLPDTYVKCILVHEYTHWLQWKLGKGVNPLPIFPVGKIPVTPFIKKVYGPEDWVIETEARWMETHPELLEELEVLVEEVLEEEGIPEPPFECDFLTD